MTDKTRTDADVEAKLWDAIDHHKTGMLGLAGEQEHFQPMTAFVERDTGSLWFFTSKDTDLARACATGAEAMFTFQSHDLYACVDGRLTLENDRARIDRYWNASVAAWYPQGKDDPSLTLMRLDADDAAIWLVEGGLVKYAIEVVRANVGKTTPDIGERRDLDLH